MNKKKIIDYILLTILTVLVIFGSFVVWNVRSLPDKWKIAILAVSLLIYLIIALLHIKSFTGKQLIVRRIGTGVLIVTFAIASFSTYKGDETIRIITNPKANQDKYTTISIITSVDSSIKKVDDLSKHNIGIQNGMDIENANFGKESLMKEASNLSFVEDTSYMTLANKLTNHEIDGLIITSTALKTVESEIEGFETKIRVVTTYKKKEVAKTVKTSKKDISKEPFTVLLSGIDTTDTAEASDRSDVVMVLLVNPNTNHVEMVSFPRDSYIPNLALGGGLDKLTHTSNNGIENIIDSIENVLGFGIDFYVQVNFTSLVELVDIIGGIDVDVKISFTEQNSMRSFAEGDLIHLEKGMQTLNGEQALAYARNRYDQPEGDIGRTRAQQDIIKAIVEKVLQPGTAIKIPKLLDVIPKYIRTDMSYEQASDFIRAELDSLHPWTLTGTSLDNGGFDNLTTASMGNTPLSVYILNKFDLQTVFNRYQMIFNPTKFASFNFDLENMDKDFTPYVASSGTKFVGDNFTAQQSNEPTYEPEEEYIPSQNNNNNNNSSSSSSSNNNNTIPEEEPVTPKEDPVTPPVEDPEIPKENPETPVETPTNPPTTE